MITSTPNSQQVISMIEKIHWIKPIDRTPDDLETVLIITPGDEESVWPGYYDGKIWRTADGFAIKADDVAYWSPMPRGPK